MSELRLTKRGKIVVWTLAFIGTVAIILGTGALETYL